MNVGNHRQRFGRIERSAFRELDIDVERIRSGKFDVEPVAGPNGLLTVRYLVGKPIARLKLGVAERECDDDDKAYRGVESGPRYHAYCNPAAKTPQDVQRGVHVPDGGNEFGL